MLRKFPSRRLFWIVTVALALTVAAESAVLAVGIAKKGKAVTAVRTVVSYDLITTTSSVPVAMPDMSTTIIVPAGQRALLIITVAGETNCVPVSTLFDGHCKLRIRVGEDYASPDVVGFDSASDAATLSDLSWQTNSMQFVYGPLSSGSHTVTVLWWIEDSTNGDDTIFKMGARTLTVLRSKV